MKRAYFFFLILFFLGYASSLISMRSCLGKKGLLRRTVTLRFCIDDSDADDEEWELLSCDTPGPVEPDTDSDECVLTPFGEPDPEDERMSGLITLFVKHLLVERKLLKCAYDEAKQAMEETRDKWRDDEADPYKEMLYSLALSRFREIEWEWFSTSKSPVYQRLEMREPTAESLLEKTCPREDHGRLRELLTGYEYGGILPRAIKSTISECYYGFEDDQTMRRKTRAILGQFPRVRKELFDSLTYDDPLNHFIQRFAHCRYSFD